MLPNICQSEVRGRGGEEGMGFEDEALRTGYHVALSRHRLLES